jgi:hypothetical protein
MSPQVATEVQKDVVIEQKEFELPTEDQHLLELTTVTNLGKQKTKFGEKLRVRFSFTVLDQKASDGGDLLVFKSMTQSLHPDSDLFKFLGMLGIDASDKKNFNVTKLIGTRFLAELTHNKAKTGPKIYANISMISRKSVKLSPAAVEAVTGATMTAGVTEI